MKKTIVVLLFVSILLTACSGSSAPKEKDFDGSAYSEMGEGTFYLSAASGTTENGEVIKVLAEKDTILMQIGAEAWDFDGSYISYFYVDGIYYDKEYISVGMQTSITLEKDMLSPGVHTVELVQFENDDENGTVVTYKSGQYEIIEK